MLEVGADPDEGDIFHWAIHSCSRDQLMESEFREIFQRTVKEFGVNVNSQLPFMVEAVEDCFVADRYNMTLV
jgi:hypothetical protein